MLIKLGQAKEEAGRAWKLVQITVSATETASPGEMLRYRLDRKRLRVVRRREGQLRSNLLGADPARLWEMYIQLTQIEEAFRNLKGDLAIRPIYHQLQNRIEAHIFIAFICLLLARDFAPPAARTGSGPDAAGSAGEIQSHSNDRRAFTYYRWAHRYPASLYPAGRGPSLAP